MTAIAVSISLPSARFLGVSPTVAMTILTFSASVWMVREVLPLCKSTFSVHTVEEQVPVLNQSGVAPFRAAVWLHIEGLQFFLEVDLRESLIHSREFVPESVFWDFLLGILDKLGP